jgi:hypothetical protein
MFVTTVGTTGTIIGATVGSTIVASGLPAGLTINGAARTWEWDGTGSAGTGSFTLTETLAGAQNTPLVSTINYEIDAAPGTLQVLTLSASSIPENSAAGTLVGAIQNLTAGSSLSLSDSAGSRFALSGTTIVAGATATNYESATSHNITIVETLTGATGSPKSTTLAITVTNVFEQPNLSALSFSSTSFNPGTSSSGTIIGATSGSTITASGLPTGLTINGPARTWAWDGTGSSGSGTFTLTETLSDSANSPRGTPIDYVIGGGLAKPTLSNYSALGAVPLVLQGSTTDYVAGLRGQLQIDNNSDFSSPEQDIVFFIDGATWASNGASIGLTTPPGTYYARWRLVRDNESGSTTITDSLGNTFTADVSSWSDTFTDTISGSAAAFVTKNDHNKNSGVNVTGIPPLSAAAIASPGAAQNVKATFGVTGKKHFEITITGLNGTGSVYWGVTDSASDISALGVVPGNAASPNGATVKLDSGGSAIYRNGGSASPAMGAVANGDVLVCEFDTTASPPTVHFLKYRGGVLSTQSTVSLTSKVPSGNWYAFFGVAKIGDAGTANFGASSFTMSPSSGYSYYG